MRKSCLFALALIVSACQKPGRDQEIHLEAGGRGTFAAVGTEVRAEISQPPREREPIPLQDPRVAKPGDFGGHGRGH